MIAYKKCKTIGSTLVKTDIGANSVGLKEKGKNGTFPCFNCNCCSNIQQGEFLYHPRKGTTIRISRRFSCIFTYACKTSRTVLEHICEHKSAIKTGKKEQAVAGHFIEAGHNVNQLRLQVIEVVLQKCRGGNRIKTLLYREAFWFRRLKTLTPVGLNKEYDLKPIFR
ncbi:hypothetical protein XELAEV_18024755mg [Xenopus laevis]|uniref:Uncharacterized protein n=1 Tax=Xenopus laevis TaxID=8355 RepID=A0A974CYB0_XENLA|nr:hypothetical protein XELAEV_18024755mg [Xenopus laevis]